jgi:hypothetical protein
MIILFHSDCRLYSANRRICNRQMKSLALRPAHKTIVEHVQSSSYCNFVSLIDRRRGQVRVPFVVP